MTPDQKPSRVSTEAEASQAVIASEVKKDEVRRFNPEQREALEKEGFKIYELTGKSVGELSKGKKPVFKYGDDVGFENLESRKSEVAIPSDRVILEGRVRSLETAILGHPLMLSLSLLGSNGKSFSEQQLLVEEFSKKISTRILGVNVIIGGVADYAELYTRVRIGFGEYYLTGFRTDTNYNGDQMWIGRCDKFGLSLEGGDPEEIDDFLYVAPLIVPVNK